MALRPPFVPPGSRNGTSRRDSPLHRINPLRVLLFGRPIPTENEEHAQMRKLIALPIFSSDAISSVAYATQEILFVLGAAGLWMMQYQELYTRMTIGITVAIVALLAIVVTSYWQTIFAYPGGGGSYIVSKENLGLAPGLVAGAALLIDYVLTVAVSIASGVQNLVGTPIALTLGLDNHVVAVCVLCVAVIAFINLRGVREAGAAFAVPTYLFVSIAALMILLGLFGPLIGWHPARLAPGMDEYQNALAAQKAGGLSATTSLTGIALVGLVLRAFANGCSAMTGTEAISNAVPGFRKPEAKNATRTLLAMAVVLGCLFIGISTLAMKLHVVYVHHQGQSSRAVIDQISTVVFGHEGWRAVLYYIMQFSTMLILVLAANTSFAGFPRLAAILARDRFMPRQLANQGDKLVFSNGILLLALFATALIVFFQGNVDKMIPLYAVGVFTAFTLSQAGMVTRWRRLRGPGWGLKAFLNGLGAVCTGVVMIVIVSEKWAEGAWIVIFVGAAQIFFFLGINRHYERLRRKLSIINWQPDATPLKSTVLVLIPSLHRGVFPAIKYARSMSPDCRAIHIETDPADVPRLRREWEQYVGEDLPLVILPSPYRSLIGPLLAYLDEVQAERPNHMVTVVLPEFVPGKWWHSLLHNANGLLAKIYLAQRRNVALTNIRYFLDDDEPETGPQGAGPSPEGGVST